MRIASREASGATNDYCDAGPLGTILSPPKLEETQPFKAVLRQKYTRPDVGGEKADGQTSKQTNKA
ncbi:MAG: hypothetical protein WBD99_04630 [Thermodesulfobacteriota bacterium]